MASMNHGDESSQIQFLVDGQQYDSGGDNQMSVSGGSTADTFFVLDTQHFTNGAHTLSVTDGTNISTISVTFTNVLSQVNITEMFDPSGQGGMPTTATISANLGAASSWTVSIVTTDTSLTPIKSWSGNSSAINISWNGTNTAGTQVVGDAYEVDITTSAPRQGAMLGQSVVANAAVPNGQGTGINYQSIANLISDTDVFLWLDGNAFPQGFGSMIAYAHAIKADLAPSKGIVWNTMSMLIHTKNHHYTPAEIARINYNFSHPLTVFYFYGHGGLGLGDDKEFSCGGSFWHSGLPDASWTAPYDTSIQQLTQNVPYGSTVNPAALVFIDSCKSGGDEDGPDLQFGE